MWVKQHAGVVSLPLMQGLGNVLLLATPLSTQWKSRRCYTCLKMSVHLRLRNALGQGSRNTGRTWVMKTRWGSPVGSLLHHFTLSVLGRDKGYTVKYIPSSKRVPLGFALGTPWDEGVHLTVDTKLSPNMDTVYTYIQYIQYTVYSIQYIHYILLNNGILKSNSLIFPRSEGYITQYTP